MLMKTPLRKLMRPFTGPLFLNAFVSPAILSQRAMAQETMNRLTRTFLAIVLLALTFGFSQTAFAEKECCWIDVATGKKTATIPLAGINMREESTKAAGVAVVTGDDENGVPNRAKNTRTGKEYKKTPEGCWIDVATGKKTATIPLAGINMREESTKAAGVGVVTGDDENGVPNRAKNTRTGKEYKRVPCPEPAAAVEPRGVMFRTGEVQLNLFGIGGTGQGENNGTDTGTRTALITETHKEHVNPNDPKSRLRDVTTTREMRARHKSHKNGGTIQGGFGGAGAEAKVFVTQNIGLGLEGDWLDGDGSFGAVMGTVTARFPMGSNAPYVFGGAGVQFGDQTKAVGKLGGGIEHRFSPHCGVFVDAAWMFADHENAAVFRAGVSIVR